MSDKTPLRKIYEREHKPVTDRTWYRVKKRLNIKEPILEGSESEATNLLRAYIYLTRAYPNRAIDLAIVQRFMELKLFLLENPHNSYCTGEEIFQLAKKLKPMPSDSTIYRWGEELGIGFSKIRIYNSTEVNQWVEKIAVNPKYRFKPKDFRRLDSEQG